jgi:hypothetical protein
MLRRLAKDKGVGFRPISATPKEVRRVTGADMRISQLGEVLPVRSGVDRVGRLARYWHDRHALASTSILQESLRLRARSRFEIWSVFVF